MATSQGGSRSTPATQFMRGNESNVLFDQQSVESVSIVVQVDDQPIMVRAHHLGPFERVLVEMVDGEGAGEHHSPYMRGGTQVRLTRKCNQIAIAAPGRYRFVLDGVAPGIPYVHYFRASMTHEFLLMESAMSCCDDVQLPTTLPPCGPAGGDLEGEYPNPQVKGTAAAERISESKPAMAIMLEALLPLMADNIQQAVKDMLPKSLPPSGDAGGDLSGTYPNPTVDGGKAVERIVESKTALSALADALAEKMPGAKAIDLSDMIAKDPSATQILANALCDAMACCIREMAANPATIAAVFNRCDGTPHRAGDSIPTCYEVDDKIHTAIGAIPADRFLEIVGYDENTHVLSFTVNNGGPTFTVNLSDLLPVVPGSGLSGNGTIGNPLAVDVGALISQDGGNLIENRNGRLYYGIQAPEDLSNLYVSTSAGNDSNPGTKAAPLKTLDAAFRKLSNSPVTYNIRLKAGETFSFSDRHDLELATIAISWYGDPVYRDWPAATSEVPYYDPGISIELMRPRIVSQGKIWTENPSYSHNGWLLGARIELFGLIIDRVDFTGLTPLHDPGVTFETRGVMRVHGCQFPRSAQAGKSYGILGAAAATLIRSTIGGSMPAGRGLFYPDQTGPVLTDNQWVGDPTGGGGILPPYTPQAASSTFSVDDWILGAVYSAEIGVQYNFRTSWNPWA